MYEILEQYISSKANISKADFETIQSVFVPKKLRKKQYFLQEGDVCNRIAFICNGCMRLYRVDAKGTEHIVQFAFENWWITDRESALTKLPSMYNIDAIEDTDMLMTTPEQLDSLSLTIPAFGDMMRQLQAKNFIAIQKRINATLSYSAEEKYRELLHLQPEILLRAPLSMVASYLGITRETLSRIRNKM